MSFNKLFYNHVDFRVEGNKIIAAPNFLCPVCGEHPQHHFNEEFKFNINKQFDFNREVTFTIPCCNTQIMLNVAVHKEKGEVPMLRINVPEIPIPNDWWMVTAQ